MRPRTTHRRFWLLPTRCARTKARMSLALHGRLRFEAGLHIWPAVAETTCRPWLLWSTKPTRSLNNEEKRRLWGLGIDTAQKNYQTCHWNHKDIMWYHANSMTSFAKNKLGLADQWLGLGPLSLGPRTSAYKLRAYSLRSTTTTTANNTISPKNKYLT